MGHYARKSVSCIGRERAPDIELKPDTSSPSDCCQEDNHSSKKAFEVESNINLSIDETIIAVEPTVSDISFNKENEMDKDINFEIEESGKMTDDSENCQKDIEVVACDWDIASEVVQSKLVEDEGKCWSVTSLSHSVSHSRKGDRVHSK